MRHEETMYYEFWRHKTSGEIWAVCFNDLELLEGSCGPLEHHEVLEENLPRFDYFMEPDDTDWIRHNDEEFDLHEPQYIGKEV